jgi:ferredoxin-NADP reductase
MAATLVHARDGRPIYLFLGFRNSREQPFRSRLSDCQADAANIHVDVSYSRPAATDQPGRDYAHRGHVDLARLRRVLPSSNFRFYVCGPAAMMQSLVPGLLDWGVPVEDIRYEAFGPATVKGLGADAAAAPCEVRFARSERAVRWTGAENSLLELAEASGIALDYGCRAGNCGQCRVLLAAGRVAHLKEPGVPLVAGECLACIARPEGDVVLDA